MKAARSVKAPARQRSCRAGANRRTPPPPPANPPTPTLGLCRSARAWVPVAAAWFPVHAGPVARSPTSPKVALPVLGHLMFACAQCKQCIGACHNLQCENPNGGLLTDKAREPRVSRVCWPVGSRGRASSLMGIAVRHD